MSIEALAWVKTVTTGSPTRKLTLLILADYADDTTWTCQVGQQQMADEAELGLRTVRRCLDILESAGLLTRRPGRRGDGYRAPDHITLHPAESTDVP